MFKGYKPNAWVQQIPRAKMGKVGKNQGNFGFVEFVMR